MDADNISPDSQPLPPFHETNEDTPAIGGGLPVIEYWAEHTLSPEGPKLWQTLLHKSACLSCSWGTGGQKGGFTNEEGEKAPALHEERRGDFSRNYAGRAHFGV